MPRSWKARRERKAKLLEGATIDERVEDFVRKTVIDYLPGFEAPSAYHDRDIACRIVHVLYKRWPLIRYVDYWSGEQTPDPTDWKRRKGELGEILHKLYRIFPEYERSPHPRKRLPPGVPPFYG